MTSIEIDVTEASPEEDYPTSDRLQDLRDSRSATFAIVHKVREMRRAGDKPRVPYTGGPICPYYSAEDLARYEGELAALDRAIASLSRDTTYENAMKTSRRLSAELAGVRGQAQASERQ
jgi:hypothetical protein